MSGLPIIRPQVTTLDNGVRVVTDPMPSVETVSVGAWVAVGTRHEAAPVNGVSHFLEHMAFKGTRRRSARAIAEEIEAVGGHLNAYTTREHTAYYAKVLKEDTPLAMDILSDILLHSLMDDEEVARERTVILQEIYQANDTPDDVVFDKFQETAFPDQALGRPVLGSPDGIRAMNRDALMAHMRDHYTGPGLVVSAAGRIEHDTLVDLARRTFGTLPATPAQPHEPARYAGGDVREPRDLEQVQVVLGFDGITYADPDFYAASVFSTLFGGGMSSRLFQEIREDRGLVYSIYSFLSCYQDGGLFGIAAGTGPDEAAELLPLVCDEINKAREHITEDETQRARAQLKASILMSLESTSTRCEQRARQLMVFDRLLDSREVVERIDAVTTEEVTRVASRLTASRPTLATLGPVAGIQDLDVLEARLG